MPREIDREGVRRLVDQGAQLVEVLPAHEYEEEHLPSAVNLPLRRLENAPITTSDGRLVGLLLRADAVRTAHELHQAEGDSS